MTDEQRFSGKTAFLTGVASGLGRATAMQLAREGASVFGVDVDADGLDATRAAITDAGGACETRVVDVRSRDACHDAVAAAVSEFGGLHIVGNIAGVARSHHFTDVTEADYDLIMGVNMAGMFWVSQAAMPHLLESHGTLINIASNAGLMGQAYTVPYCTSKGAVVQFTKSLAMEYVKSDVRINALAPGGMKTALVDGFNMPADLDFSLMQNYMGYRDMAEAEEVASVFAFLASDAASAVHGSIWSADGGLTAS